MTDNDLRRILRDKSWASWKSAKHLIDIDENRAAEFALGMSVAYEECADLLGDR